MSEKIDLYLRKGKNQYGEYLYFFSRTGKLVFYLNADRVRELLDGKRDWVCIVGKPVKKKED